MNNTTIEKNSIYGNNLPALENACAGLSKHISDIRNEMNSQLGMDPVEHYLTRIKSEESMREKCVRKGFPVNQESALSIIKDAIGVRIVCAFVDDVFTIRDKLKSSGRYEVIEEKDYINHAKPNGYRSYHMILKLPEGFFAEIQLRTISMDTWAALEHHLKYKKDLRNDCELIVNELKRCADELASTDLSMQTIRDMILEQ